MSNPTEAMDFIGNERLQKIFPPPLDASLSEEEKSSDGEKDARTFAMCVILCRGATTTVLLLVVVDFFLIFFVFFFFASSKLSSPPPRKNEDDDVGIKFARVVKRRRTTRFILSTAVVDEEEEARARKCIALRLLATNRFAAARILFVVVVVVKKFVFNLWLVVYLCRRPNLIRLRTKRREKRAQKQNKTKRKKERCVHSYTLLGAIACERFWFQFLKSFISILKKDVNYSLTFGSMHLTFGSMHLRNQITEPYDDSRVLMKSRECFSRRSVAFS